MAERCPTHTAHPHISHNKTYSQREVDREARVAAKGSLYDLLEAVAPRNLGGQVGAAHHEGVAKLGGRGVGVGDSVGPAGASCWARSGAGREARREEGRKGKEGGGQRKLRMPDRVRGSL